MNQIVVGCEELEFCPLGKPDANFGFRDIVYPLVPVEPLKQCSVFELNTGQRCY